MGGHLLRGSPGEEPENLLLTEASEQLREVPRQLGVSLSGRKHRARPSAHLPSLGRPG